MRPRNLLLILAIFLFVVSFYIVFERVYVPKKDAKGEREGKVFSFDLDDEIDEIIIVRRGEKIVLKMEEGKEERWIITSPLKTDADSAEVVSYLAKALDVQRQKKIGTKDEMDKAELSGFGLKEPRFSLTLKTKDESQTLYVGGFSPTEDFVYAERDGDGLIFTAKKSVLTDLDIDLIQLRERGLVAFPLRVTREFKVERGGKIVRVNRTALGSWKIVEPIEFAADVKVVKEVLNFIYDSKAQRYLDEEAPDLGKYGLDAPLITFTTTDKAGAISVLKIGDKDEEGNYYAKVEGLPWIFTVKESVKNKLTLSAEALMEKVVLDYTVADVSGFNVTVGGEKIECVRVDKAWKIVKPEKTLGDKAAVDNLLWDFKDLKFIDVVEKPAVDLVKYGLDKPAVVFNVAYSKEGKDKKGKGKIMIGKVEGKTAYGYSQGLSKGEDFVFTFPAEKVENLTPTLFGLKDKSLLRFEKEDVSYIEIVWDSKTYEFQKKRDKWRVISPEEKSVESDDVKYLLEAVRDLVYFKVISPDDNKKGVFGLHKPKKKITLKNKDGDEVGVIKLGKVNEEDGYVSAASSALKGVYGVKPDLVKELGSDIEDFFK